MTTMYKCSEASTGTTRFEDNEVFFLLLKDFILRDEAATKRLLFLYPKKENILYDSTFI